MAKSGEQEWDALQRPPRFSSPEIVTTLAAPPSQAPTAPLPPADREVHGDQGTLRLIPVADNAMSAPGSVPAPTEVGPRPPANSSTEGGSWALEMTGTAPPPPSSSSSPFGSTRLGSAFFAIGVLATLLAFGATQLLAPRAAKLPSTAVKSALAAAPVPVDDVSPPAPAVTPRATSIPAAPAPPPVTPPPPGAKPAPTPATARASATRKATTPKPASTAARPKTTDAKTTEEILRQIGEEQLRR